jgi:hypothetical protein
VALAVGCVAILLVTWRQHSEGAAGNQAAAHLHATYSFTCCKATDVNTVRHPGETFVLHWISTPGSPSPARPVSLTLSASISGPFGTARALKKALGSRGTEKTPSLEVLNAKPIHPTTWNDRPLLTEIPIPRNAPAGLYNLKFTVASANTSGSGDSIITIDP